MAGGVTSDIRRDAKATLKPLRKTIKKSLRILDLLNGNLSKYEANAQQNIITCLNSFVSELDALQKVAENITFQVPSKVIRLIDDGKNPDEYMKDHMEMLVDKSQKSSGKIEAFRNLRKLLIEELEQEFPEEVEAYRKLRGIPST